MILSKKYADTDFFLALMKNSDWLKEKAIKIYNEYKEEIYITPFTVAEIMIICRREKINIKETLFQISRIAKLENIDWQVFLKACDYMQKGATIFDSLLMASCNEENKIISSDNVYQKFGSNIIDIKNH